ncbi:MAG: hypothetical protein GY757_50540 [bacterium]|nr:hypothetical protein [bacterium]
MKGKELRVKVEDSSCGQLYNASGVKKKKRHQLYEFKEFNELYELQKH